MLRVTRLNSTAFIKSSFNPVDEESRGISRWEYNETESEMKSHDEDGIGVE